MSGHPADADYLSQNLPNETELDAMMESALALADVMQGRRRVASDGRGVPVVGGEEMYVLADVTPVKRPAVLRPAYEPAVLREAMEAAGDREPSVGPVEATLVRYAASVIAEQVTRLRAIRIENPILSHALNTLDLGVVGLARVAGKEGNDA